jgi:hypothetical protein
MTQKCGQSAAKIYGFLFLLIATGLGITSIGQYIFPQLFPAAISSTPAKDVTVTLRHETRTIANSTIHILRIPADRQHRVSVSVSPTLKTVAEFARSSKAIAVLNAGFFDPANQLTNSYMAQDGKLIADPRQNPRLITNPALQPYLKQILNRSELRVYRCGSDHRYGIAHHNDPAPQGCGIAAAVGGGPRLLPELAMQSEGFWDVANGQVIRDPLGSQQPNARSAVGITASGSLIWVMVAQKPGATASGLSLQSLATFFKTLDVKAAMNLDGGSSASLFYQGKTHYGKVDEQGNLIQRPVKSVLLLHALD